MLINTKKDVTFLSPAALQNFYSGFLELANTDHSLIYAIEE
jgi:phosphoenolpyruvate carboxylase